VFNLGLVDTPQKAIDAGHACRRNDIDILLIYVSIYTLSAIVLLVILRVKVPVVLLNLQPARAIEYEKLNSMTSRTAMTGEWLAYCSSCLMPEIANVLGRLDMRFYQVTGMLHNDPECWQASGR
jgi:L-arabinose isomerase